MHAWVLGCFHSLISTQTFQRALTTLVDCCTEIKSAPSVWRKVSESNAWSVRAIMTQKSNMNHQGELILPERHHMITTDLDHLQKLSPGMSVNLQGCVHSTKGTSFWSKFTTIVIFFITDVRAMPTCEALVQNRVGWFFQGPEELVYDGQLILWIKHFTDLLEPILWCQTWTWGRNTVNRQPHDMINIHNCTFFIFLAIINHINTIQCYDVTVSDTHNCTFFAMKVLTITQY